MSNKKIVKQISLAEALKMGPPPAGNLAVPVFQHGTLEAELYSPVAVDSQTPHARDEIYLVIQGQGEFYDGNENRHVGVGDFIFVAAGAEHRFENFSDDFTTWVFFYGPDGGESS